MKLKSTSLFLGIALAGLAAAGIPAYARTTTGFSAFHVELQGSTSTDAYDCLIEDFGAVVNKCGYDVSLEFDLPIDNTGSKTVTIQDFWGIGTPSSPFTCELYSYGGTTYPGTENPEYVYGGSTTFYDPAVSQSIPINVANNGWSIQVICYNVPPGAGIANLNWQQ